MMNVRDKVCIITGSASGLGKAYAEILLENGAYVCISDVNEAKGKETLEEFGKKFRKDQVYFIQCDVTKQNQFLNLYEQTEKHFKKDVELLVNNAGISPELGWRKCMDVNIYGVMIGMEIALEKMSKSSCKGTIVNCASLAGCVTGSTGLLGGGAASYYASKHACVSVSRDSANEFENNGVVVKCLCPAYANTAIIKLSDPEKQARMDKKVKEIGLLEPREVADGFYRLVTQCKNGSVMAVIKDYPAFLIPDYNMAIVLGLGLVSKLVYTFSGGLEVVKPIHQFLCLVSFMILLFCFVGWIL